MSVAHVPITTSAGHYLSMQPAESTLPLEKVWYRGDEYALQMRDAIKFRAACQAVLDIFSDPNSTGDSESLIEILDIVERALK